MGGTLQVEGAGGEFLLSLHRKGFKPRTCEGYRQVLGPFQSFLENRHKTDLRSVTKGDVNAYQLLMAGRYRSSETRRTHLKRLKTFFDFLRKENLLLFDPAEGLFCGKSRGAVRLPVVLTRGEMDKILSLPFDRLRLGARDKAIVELLYSSGLRVSELCRLKVEDIDWMNRLIRVEEGKGGKDREVPLGEKAAESLRGYLVSLRERLDRDRRQEIFLSTTGRPLDKNSVAALLRKYGGLAGLSKRIYPHLLRHTMATHLLAGGAPLSAVQGILGHERLVTTQIYTHVCRRELKRWYRRSHPQARLLKEKEWRQALFSNPTSVIGR